MDGLGDDAEFAALLRGLSDPEALADLRGRYRGTTDLIDALRWRLDPKALGQDGSLSPAVRAEALKQIAYRRPENPDDERRTDAAASELRALLATSAADSAALDSAIRGHLARHDEPPAPIEAEAEPAASPRGRFPLRRAALLGGAALLAIATLVGVAYIAQPRGCGVECAEPVDAADSPSPTPTPTRSSPPPTAPVAPPPQAATPPPEDTDLRPNYFEEDILSLLQVPINGAPIDNATGTADVDAYGVPLSYVVADGDVFELIAKRFDISVAYLAGINAVRRENPTELFVGDTLNLGATTILQIGDQNGVVYNYTERLPEPHMPQE